MVLLDSLTPSRDIQRSALVPDFMYYEIVSPCALSVVMSDGARRGCHSSSEGTPSAID